MNKIEKIKEEIKHVSKPVIEQKVEIKEIKKPVVSKKEMVKKTSICPV